MTFHLRVVPKIEDNEKPSMFFGPYIIDFVHDIKATIDIDLYLFLVRSTKIKFHTAKIGLNIG